MTPFTDSDGSPSFSGSSGVSRAMNNDPQGIDPEPQGDARPIVNTAHRRRRILLVEPSSIEAQKLRERLSMENLEVHSVQDVITAIQAATIHRPNLILSNIRLPILSGLDLIRRLGDDPATSSIPVILFGDQVLSDERARAFDAGARDVISKPFTTTELVARLRAELRNRDDLTALERRAHRDGLTGLANRGVLEDQLAREWQSCRRRSTPLAIVMVDLDHFKSINDVHGHATGDEVLRRAARVLARAARASDLAARYGGEEFVVVAPGANLEIGLQIAKRFRAELAQVVVNTGGTELKVTASVGVACAQFDGTLDAPAQLLHRADTALYEAKRSGRDAIWTHDPILDAPAPAVPSHSPIELGSVLELDLS